MAEKAFIVEAVRTAGGKRDGRLSLWHPADLGAKVLDEIVSRLDMDPELRIHIQSRDYLIKYFCS